MREGVGGPCSRDFFPSPLNFRRSPFTDNYLNTPFVKPYLLHFENVRSRYASTFCNSLTPFKMPFKTTIKAQSEPGLIIRTYSGQEQLSKDEIKVCRAATGCNQDQLIDHFPGWRG